MSRTVDDLLNQIDEWVREHQSSLPDVTAEMWELINRYDPTLERPDGAKKGNLPLVAPSFDSRPTLLKLREIFQQDVKIPRLRNVADNLSRATGIPLPKAVRNNKDALFQYFQNHWDVFSPLLAHDPNSFFAAT